MKDDPYHDRKKYHYPAFFREDGKVSALCFKRPRAIDLRRALWTFQESAVTCQNCVRMLMEESPGAHNLHPSSRVGGRPVLVLNLR